MSIRLYVLLALLLLVIGYSLGRYFTPQKVVTKTVIETKTVTVVQRDTQTTVTEKPDGTKTTVIVDKSIDTTHQDQTIDKTKTVENNKPDWHVGLQLAPKNPQYEYFYGVQVERRILGPVFVGAFGDTDRTLGLVVGLEF